MPVHARRVSPDVGAKAPFYSSRTRGHGAGQPAAQAPPGWGRGDMDRGAGPQVRRLRSSGAPRRTWRVDNGW